MYTDKELASLLANAGFETRSAILLANEILDQHSRDPDDDLSVLSRQFLRAYEVRERFCAALTEIRDILPLQNDAYARRVFAIAAEALEPST